MPNRHQFVFISNKVGVFKKVFTYFYWSKSSDQSFLVTIVKSGFNELKIIKLMESVMLF